MEERTFGSLFEDCSNMVTADLSGFDTSATTSLQRYGGGQGYGIFTRCTSLTTITGMGGWNTSNFTNISSAFLQCKSLTSLSGLENWDVSHVTDMEATFRETDSVTDYSPLSGWNTSSLQDMNQTFEGSGHNGSRVADFGPEGSFRRFESARERYDKESRHCWGSFFNSDALCLFGHAIRKRPMAAVLVAEELCSVTINDK